MGSTTKRLISAAVVIAIVAGAARLAMTQTPIVGYRPVDDFNLAIQVTGDQPQWRGATISETDSTVTIDLREIWFHGPGFDDTIAYVLVRLQQPLGTRTVVDASSGLPVRRMGP